MKLLRNRLALLTILVGSFCSNGYGQCEPFFGKLVINEVMAGNDNTAADEMGEFEDWVEIHNNSDEAIDLTGYFLSDNHGNKTKFPFPAMDIEAGEFLIVWCDDEVEEGPCTHPLSSAVREKK